MEPQGNKAELERQLAEERAQRARDAADDDAPANAAALADDAPANDHAPADAPANAPADDGPSMERQAEVLSDLMDGFETGLRELFGIDDALEQVPMDGMFGFMLPGTLDYKTNEKFRRCSTCNGQGEVLTGSMADGKQTANCPRCDGRGYLEKLEADTPPGEPRENVAGAVDDEDAGYGVPKWMGNPDVGRS